MSYIWLAKAHPTTTPSAKTGKRLRLPPNKVHRDRKNDFMRKAKHPAREV